MGILIGAIVVSAIVFMFIYNGIVSKKNEVSNAMGGMDTYLKQRYDLIPNIVEATKQYMQHEKQVLEDIVKLRSTAMEANKSNDVVEANNKISKALSGLMVQVENYPELKSNQNFIQLQNALKDVEENIAASRRYFNAAVTDFNNALEMFPSSIVASMMGQTKKNVFEISEEERKNVNIKSMF